jgi:probable lipoprotein NlpC
MQKKLYLLFLLGIIFLSCKKNKPVAVNRNQLIVNNCEKYIGTPYKYGGADFNGIDCSGLIFIAFNEAKIKIPRMADKQADFFQKIEKDDILVGDLVYFKVGSKNIDHTGIISKIIKRDEIYFIHASTSKGVREDNLFSKYWVSKFVKATRPIF